MKAKLLLLLLLVAVLGTGALLFLQSGGSRARGAERAAVAPRPATGPDERSTARTTAEPPPQQPLAEPQATERAELRHAPGAAAAQDAASAAWIQGSVQGPDGPIAGADVRLRSLDHVLQEVHTGADGVFRMQPPSLEVALRLCASSKGYAPLEIELAAEPSRRFVGTLRLTPAVPLRVLVLGRTGAPAAKAEVEISKQLGNLYVYDGTTDEHGRCSFPDAPPGRIRVVARTAALGSDAKDLVHQSDEEVQLQLSDRNALLLAFVDARGGPVPDLAVTLTPSATPQPVLQGRTDEQGRCRFDALDTDLWDARVLDPRFRPIVRSGLQANGVEIQVQVSAWPCGRGNVVAPGGGPPPPGTMIQMLPAGIHGDLTRFGGGVRSDVRPDGTFEVCGLRPGQYQARVEAEGYAPTPSPPFDVRVEGDVDIGTIVLQEGGVLALVVRTPTDTKGKARVELYPAPPNRQLLWTDRLGREMESAESGVGGAVRFDHLGAGDVWLIVRAPDCVPQILGPYTIADGTTVAPDPIVLEHGAHVAGIVRADGKPVAGALVFLSSPGEQGAALQLSTDADGRFASPALPAGAWTVRARSFTGANLDPSQPQDVVLGHGEEKEIEISL